MSEYLIRTPARPGSLIRAPVTPTRFCEVVGDHGTARPLRVQLHHLEPKSWGGNPSEAEADHRIVWIWACGCCHDSVHVVLDHMKKLGAWDASWLLDNRVPLAVRSAAKRGWDIHQNRIAV